MGDYDLFYLLRASKFEKNFLLYNTPKKNIYLVYTIYNNKLLYIIYPIYIKKKGNFVFFDLGGWKGVLRTKRDLKKRKSSAKKKRKYGLGCDTCFLPFFLPCGVFLPSTWYSWLVVVLFVALCRCFLFFERWQKTMFFFGAKRNSRNFPNKIYLFWVYVVIVADIQLMFLFSDSGVYISFLSSWHYNPIIHTPLSVFMSRKTIGTCFTDNFIFCIIPQ